ncbi:MAG TPA: hypothetical protein VHO69_06485 [Phototrophicaceae bacterium]|nr:hypothetical protein [Phototrophicaceae bacterium]
MPTQAVQERTFVLLLKGAAPVASLERADYNQFVFKNIWRTNRMGASGWSEGRAAREKYET